MNNDIKRKKVKWFRLDNAALIFPAVLRPGWNNVFRMSATLSEPVDPAVLEQAVADIKPRFPTFFVKLRTGFFWCYLQEINTPVEVREDYAYPLTHMSLRELHKCCIRVLYYNNRIAVEFFHSVTDGTGGSIFLQTLVSRYITLRYRKKITPGGGVLDIAEKPRREELEDGFLRCASDYSFNRSEKAAYRLHGTPETDFFRHLTTGVIDTGKLLEAAHGYKVSVTVFLAAVMAESIIKIQAAERKKSRWKPVKITIPVNLRKMYGHGTLRNFALTVNIGVNPKYGDYTLGQLCTDMSHELYYDATPQRMAGSIAANVNPQKSKLLRIMPLFIKNIAMKLVYHARGERMGSINISNLGQVRLPEEMTDFVTRMEFIIGVQLSYPNNCSVISYGGKTYVNMIRSIKESELERLFFSRLVELGVPVAIESNERRDN